jgi:dTMP kinase
LEEAGIAYRHAVFPRYKEESSALVRLYLQGAFGTKPGDVNAFAASAFYAVDRFASYRQDWGEAYQQGGLILCDRYTTSNAVHQAAKLPEAERENFWHWLYEFEFDKLGLPRPDLVLYLDMPTDQSVHLLRSREEATQTHADIHEQDTAYLAACRGAACKAAEVLGWTKIPCTKDGALRSIEEIHGDLWQRVLRTLEK